MKLIYIAGPYTAETKEGTEINIAKAEEIGIVVELEGHIPVIPHRSSGCPELIKFAELNGWQHQDWMEKFCLPLLQKCDAIFLMENWQQSKGATMEKEYSEKHGIPIIKNFQELVTL